MRQKAPQHSEPEAALSSGFGGRRLDRSSTQRQDIGNRPNLVTTRRKSFAPRTVRLVGLIGSIVIAAACNEEFDFKNTQPVISAVGPVTMTTSTEARIHLWVVDYEGDPVDVDIQVGLDGNTWRSLNAQEVSGHGLLGLTSDPEFPGREHVVTWHTDISADLGFGLDPTVEVRIRVVPDDRRSGGGILLTSPGFKLVDGLTEPYTQVDDGAVN